MMVKWLLAACHAVALLLVYLPPPAEADENNSDAFAEGEVYVCCASLLTSTHNIVHRR
jgi:hypothetical protein